MIMDLDWKCAITTAILSVLIYLIIVNLLSKDTNKVGKSMNEQDVSWYESNEVIMLASVFLGFILNGYLFQSCKL